MTSFRIRPRFRVTTRQSPDDISSRIREEAARQGARCTATVVRGFIVLSIPDAERHVWSPQLTLQIEELPGEGSLIRGLYAPSPTVWTMFMFGYIGIATLAFFAAIYGFARIALGQPGDILWGLPALGLLAAILYIIAQTGQKLGAGQTYDIHHFLEETLDLRIGIH